MASRFGKDKEFSADLDAATGRRMHAGADSVVPNWPAQVESLPGGGLPLETAAMPMTTPAAPHGPHAQRSTADGGLQLLPDDADARELTPQPPQRLHVPSATRPLDRKSRGNPMRDSADQRDRDGRGDDDESDESVDAQRQRSAERGRRLPGSSASLPATHVVASATAEDQDEAQTIDWMHRLHDADRRVAEQAAAELAQRGYDETQLEMARQLTSPDLAVRTALAESLPSAPGIDPRMWLLWLSRDEQPDVRLSALTVMATSQDPRLMKRVEEMTRTDADRRIQQQGERLLGNRKKLRY